MKNKKNKYKLLSLETLIQQWNIYVKWHGTRINDIIVSHKKNEKKKN